MAQIVCFAVVTLAHAAPEALADDLSFADILDVEDHTLTTTGLTEMYGSVLAHRTKQLSEQQHRQRLMYSAAVDEALTAKADTLFQPDHRFAASDHRRACAERDQTACAKLGAMYLAGDGTPPDLQLGYALSFFACEAGDDLGCTTVFGSALEQSGGHHPGPYPELAHFAERCEGGRAWACENLGKVYLYGVYSSVDVDEVRSEAFFQRACNLGKENACKSQRFSLPTVEEDTAACSANDAVACFRMAGRHLRGTDTKPDVTGAIRLYRKSCSLAYGPGCAALAQMHDTGRYLDANPAEALSLYERACRATPKVSARACLIAGQWRETGQGGDVDLDKALAHYRAYCDESQHTCADFWRLKAVSFDPYTASADRFFAAPKRSDAERLRIACAGQDATACVRLAELYLAEEAMERRAVAQHVMARACRLGDASGCVTAGHLKRDYTSAALFQIACDAGLDEGCVAFASQAAIAPEVRFAALWESCTDGGGRSCLTLAALYAGAEIYHNRRDGLHPEKDVGKATAFLERACDLNDADACTYLAREIDDHQGNDYFHVVRQDTARAKDLFERACALGSAWGCSQTAYLYQHGELFEKDLMKALGFARRACTLGSYCDLLAGIEVALERDRLTTAHGAVRAAQLAHFDGIKPTHYGRFRRARAGCGADDMNACVTLGRLYQISADGDDAVEPYAVATEWSRALFRHACDGGLAAGCAAYGESFRHIGDESQPDITIAYFEKACDLGDGDACAELGRAYGHGWDVPEDKTRAHAYILLGCAYGSDFGCSLISTVAACLFSYGWACEDLGVRYERGRRQVPRDLDVAALLYRIGCAHHHEASCNASERLSQR